jgi:hypothetical protein
MFKPNQYPKVQAIYVSLLAVVWSIYAYCIGVVSTLDSSVFSNLADTLIEYNFDIFNFSENYHNRIPAFFYTNWITILSSSKALLGEHWSLGVVVLNLLAGIIAALLLLKTSWTITGKPACAIFVGLLLLLCHDYFLWIPYVLSDTSFSLISFSIFILTISFYQRPSKYLKRVVGIVILFSLTIFFRPTWPPLLLFTVLSIPLIFIFQPIATDSIKRHNFIIGCVLFACIFIPIIIFCHSYLMMHPEKWPFPFLGEQISAIEKGYKLGIVIYQHPETYHATPHSILDYAFISFHKIVAFFYISVESYSFTHSLVNYTFFLPVYGLSIWAIAQLFKKNNGPSPSHWWSIFSCAIFIFFIAFFHSLQELDYDFRYRVPCLLPLIFLASLGLNELINGFPQKFSLRLQNNDPKSG